MKIQVLTFGHPLSEPAERKLKNMFPNAQIRLIHISLHVTRFDQVVIEVERLIEMIRERGGDLTGRDRTMVVCPGSSVVTAVFIALWYGMTGNLPEVINMIKRGPTLYVPSPELPIIDLGGLRTSARKDKRSNLETNVIVRELNDTRALQPR